MKKIIVVLFFILVATFGAGFYLKYIDNSATGDLLIGLTILAAIFILMPMFLYHRWKGKDVKKYMLTEDNIKKMKDFSEGKKPDNQ